MRRVISVLVVVGLALAVVLLWANRGGDTTPATDAQASSTTSQPTTTTLPADTTTLSDTTTSSPTEVEVVETVEQAEAILRELWFGWFEGIYNEDEDRIREVVATEHQYQLAVEQFGSMTFEMQPSADDITYSDTELLLATDSCTVVSTTGMFSGFVQAETSDVHVLRWNDGWKIFSLWGSPDDLWEDDCSAQLS